MVIAHGSSFLKVSAYDDGRVRTIHQGMHVEPVNAFHLLAPLMQEEEIENQPYLIHAMTKEKDWIKWKFDKDVQTDSSVGSGVEQQFLSAMGVTNQNTGYEQVYVKEAWD